MYLTALGAVKVLTHCYQYTPPMCELSRFNVAICNVFEGVECMPDNDNTVLEKRSINLLVQTGLRQNSLKHMCEYMHA